MVKQHSPSPSDDEKIMMPFVKFMGLGLVVMIGIIFLFNYMRSEEYPKLLFEHSLNDNVQAVDTDRGSSFVIFETKKYQIGWGKNLRYKDFPSLSQSINTGDLIIKKAYSDTIRVKHLEKEYVYVLGQTIE